MLIAEEAFACSSRINFHLPVCLPSGFRLNLSFWKQRRKEFFQPKAYLANFEVVARMSPIAPVDGILFRSRHIANHTWWHVNEPTSIFQPFHGILLNFLMSLYALRYCCRSLTSRPAPNITKHSDKLQINSSSAHVFVDNLFRFVYSIAATTAFHGEFSFSFSIFCAKQLFSSLVFVSVAKSLGYKIIRPSNNQMPKTSLFEFNYEMRYSMQNRKQEQDMWNICWTDSIVAVDFCREMRRFQKINVGWLTLTPSNGFSTFVLIPQHFPGMFEICRKDLLARNLNRMLKLFPNDYNIFPKTWCFPAE